MSRFAQYYIRFKHDAGCYDWEQRQQHLGALFEKDESIEFYMGEDDARKVYKHRVYHLGSAPGITVMRFANEIHNNGCAQVHIHYFCFYTIAIAKMLMVRRYVGTAVCHQSIIVPVLR